MTVTDDAMLAQIMGEEVPRIFTPPNRELTPETSLGYSVIKFSRDVLGVELFPWQQWFFIHALELNEDGELRFKEIHLTIARQNGKTHVVKTFLLWRLFVHHRDQLILGAAQSRTEALFTWKALREQAVRNPILADFIATGTRQTGSETLATVGGSMYQVVTLKPNAGRGRTAGTVFLDELREHKTWEPWNALSSTTLVPKNSVVITASNAGDGKSVVMKSKRDHALGEIARNATASSRIGWFEWSADDDCDLDDPRQWAKANPSLGHTLDLEDIAKERSKSDGAFRTENLCQWVETLESGIIPVDNWLMATGRASSRPAGAPASVGLDISADRRFTSISVAFDTEDGRRHVELVAYRKGIDWAVKWLQDRLTLTESKAKRLGLPGAQTGPEWFDGRVAVQARGCPASAIIPQLTEAGITVVEVGGKDLTAAHGNFYSKVVNEVTPERPTLVHRAQPLLDEAVRMTMARTNGDSWLFDRRGSRADASPLVACSQADWLHDQPRPRSRSAYSNGASFEML